MKYLLLILLFTNSTFSQTEGVITSGNSRLHYRTFGSGKPLLIINGGPGLNSDGFVSLAKTLSAGNQSIIYDQRGTGGSSIKLENNETITMDAMIADIENLRKHLKIDQWVVLGHSFGGMLASYYATKHPESIEKLILSSSGGIDLGLRDYVNGNLQKRLTAQERDSLAYWNKKIASGDTSDKARRGRARAMAPAYVYDKKFAPDIAERLTQGDPHINELVWEDLEKIKFDCAPILKDFKKPVLILHGKDDILDIETAEKSHRAFPNSKLVLMDNCGHYGWLDAPSVYFSAINSFLKTT